MSHTRMAYLISNGFGHREMVRLNIGPVLFHEHLFYFKEVLPGSRIHVTMELRGQSKNNTLFEFVHNINGKEGTHHLRAELIGAFIDLQSRKHTPLQDHMLKQLLHDMRRTDELW